MSALVESMFSVRETPWHREGIVLGEYPGSWAEARTAAGLDWDVVSLPVPKFVGVDAATGAAIYDVEPNHHRIARSDTDASLAFVNATYEPIDHKAMGEIVEAVLEQKGVKYETAGSLDGGKAVWCLARLDEPIELPGDNTLTFPFLAITNRHDAMGGCTARATAVRIVCMNTFRAAELEGQRTGTTFTFRHTKNWRNRIDEARDAVTGARKEFRLYVELAQELMGITITDRQRELFVREFIPSPPDGIISKRVAGNIEAARGIVRKILASESTASVSHTAYGLLQAAGEYLDHARTARTWESKLNRTMMRPEPLKAGALALVRRVVAEGANA